jgi:hypothetical protein
LRGLCRPKLCLDLGNVYGMCLLHRRWREMQGNTTIKAVAVLMSSG